MDSWCCNSRQLTYLGSSFKLSFSWYSSVLMLSRWGLPMVLLCAKDLSRGGLTLSVVFLLLAIPLHYSCLPPISWALFHVNLLAAMAEHGWGNAQIRKASDLQIWPHIDLSIMSKFISGLNLHFCHVSGVSLYMSFCCLVFNCQARIYLGNLCSDLDFTSGITMLSVFLLYLFTWLLALNFCTQIPTLKEALLFTPIATKLGPDHWASKWQTHNSYPL